MGYAQPPRAPAPTPVAGRPQRRLTLKKLILLSFLIASIAIPARAARIKDGRAALKRTLIHMAIFDVIYVVLLTQVWFRL
jgi:hypothetical protein